MKPIRLPNASPTKTSPIDCSSCNARVPSHKSLIMRTATADALGRISGLTHSSRESSSHKAMRRASQINCRPNLPVFVLSLPYQFITIILPSYVTRPGHERTKSGCTANFRSENDTTFV